jgi:hypothetical protein
MAQPKSLLDPFDLLRGLASRLERRLEKAAGRGVRSDGFTRVMHQALAASLLAEGLSRQVQERLLVALNLPSRSDLLRLGERLQAVEDRIIELSADLAARDIGRPTSLQGSPRLTPPRTKKPPQMAVPTAAAAKRQRRSARQ